jgi:hypothetical protein
LKEDFLLPEDWDVLRRLELYLQPFWRTTKQLEGHAANGHYGAIWEALPTIEYLLRYLEGLKQSIPKRDARIWECINNSWVKLNSYYRKTDENYAVYAAATILHSVIRIAHFRKSWTGAMESYIQIIEARCREVWTSEFLPFKPKRAPIKNSNNTFLRDLMGLLMDTEADEFTKYDRDPTQINNLKTFNLIKW